MNTLKDICDMITLTLRAGGAIILFAIYKSSWAKEKYPEPVIDGYQGVELNKEFCINRDASFDCSDEYYYFVADVEEIKGSATACIFECLRYDESWRRGLHQ